jgi:hypothetical protein
MPRIITRLLGLTIIVCLTVFGTMWGREYYMIKMCQTCTERMWLIEEAKQKFSKDFPHRSPDTHSELMAYLPFTGFPMCPWGGEYSNKLSLKEVVTCSLNGNKEYEPETPGVDPNFNGYMDLGQEPEAVKFFDFFYNKMSWQNTKKDPLSKKKDEKRKKLFGE